MSIPKETLLKMIQDEQDKIEAIQKAKGFGITPAQIECEYKIAACKEALGKK